MGCVLRTRVVAQPPRQIQPRESRQAHIGHNCIRPNLAGALERFFAGRGRDRLETHREQPERIHRERVLVRVDDQHHRRSRNNSYVSHPTARLTRGAVGDCRRDDGWALDAEAIEVPFHHRVALARSRFQPFAVLDRHVRVGVGDQSGLLKRAGDQAHRRPG